MPWFWLFLVVLVLVPSIAVLVRDSGIVFVAGSKQTGVPLRVVGFKVFQASPPQVVHEFTFAIVAPYAVNTISGLSNLRSIVSLPLEVADHAVSTNCGNRAKSAIAFRAQHRT